MQYLGHKENIIQCLSEIPMPGILYGNPTPIPSPSQSGTIRIPNHSGLPRTLGFPDSGLLVLKPGEVPSKPE